MNWGLVLSNDGVASVGHGEEKVEFQSKAFDLVSTFQPSSLVMRFGS